MTIEFLIACHDVGERNIRQTLIELLAGVLEDNQNEFGDDVVGSMIVVRHQRISSDPCSNINHALIGFALELPEDTIAIETVITEFAAVLMETAPIFHVLKFEDPLLRTYLAERAAEIFAVEMKLRRVLSLIYLHSNQGGDPFDLLRDEFEQITRQDRPRADDMKRNFENQFFHLLFGQYAGLNQRGRINTDDVLVIVRNSLEYDSFRAEISRTPVNDEGDADLVSDLKELIDPIERMRNSVAHYRKPSNRTTSNYPGALERLNERLDRYLLKWEI